MQTAHRRFSTAAPLRACFAVGTTACADDPVATPVATSATITAGNNQSVVTGAEATTPLTVRVVDQNGTVMSGVPVAFAITGGGTLS